MSSGGGGGGWAVRAAAHFQILKTYTLIKAAYANKTEEPVLSTVAREQKILESAAAPRPATTLSRAEAVDAAATVNALAPFLVAIFRCRSDESLH